MSQSVDPSGHPTDGTGASDPDDQGGDPVCWAAMVCPDCGRLAPGRARAPRTCERCGAELPAAAP